MSTADQFRIYAKEAMLWSRKSKTEEARNAMIDPCAHMDRGCGEERIIVGVGSPPEARAP